MYGYGDVVKTYAVEREFEYYLITDCESFFNIVTQKKDYRYQIMQIYPAKLQSRVSFHKHIELKLVHRAESSEAKYLMEMVKKERLARGFHEKPDFQKAIEVNIHSSDKEFTDFTDESIPRYDLIKTLDEGVDALWDLNRFYEVFGDDSYLQLKEIVIKRMTELHKRQSKGKIHK